MITVIIPTLNAEKDISQILSMLFKQKKNIDEIIIIDSSSDDKTLKICKTYQGIKTITVDRKMFNHGNTRDYALKQSIGDIVVFMTQDAVPADENTIDNLVAPLESNDIAVSTARQLPKQDARLSEKLVRNYNYPETSRIKSKVDIPTLGIKTFFCSNVCAAYKKEVYLELGGFERDLKTNEDMFFAAKAIQNGYKIAYSADSLVYHSHNFTLKNQFKRNFFQGYEIEKHRDLLQNVDQKSEGIKLVKFVSQNLLKNGHLISLSYFLMDGAARYLGSKCGQIKYKKEKRNII